MADDDTAALYALTPLDGRYAGRVSKIRDYFSEAALIKARVRVEVEYLASLSQVIPALGDVFEGDNLTRWRAVAATLRSSGSVRFGWPSTVVRRSDCPTRSSRARSGAAMALIFTLVAQGQHTRAKSTPERRHHPHDKASTVRVFTPPSPTS